MNRKSPQGFTLVELIMYLGIVSIMLVSLSYLIIDILGSQIKTISIDDVQYQTRFLEDQLRRDIQHASGITTVTTSTLELTSPNGTIRYAFNEASSTISRQYGAAATENLTLQTIAVNGSFADYSFQQRAPQIFVQLMVSRRNPGSLSDYQASTTAQLLFDLRGKR